VQQLVKLRFDFLGHRRDPVKNSPPKERSKKMYLQQVQALLLPLPFSLTGGASCPLAEALASLRGCGTASPGC